jgi:peptidyl-prolyl cis-trans isomerase A (cyclophilin A)
VAKTFPSPKEVFPGDGELRATVQTNQGSFTVKLYEDLAPNTVSNFAGLATGKIDWTDPTTGQPGSGPFYDGVIFHRIIPGFVIQGGDRTGTGRGGPGYRFGDECSPQAKHTKAGMLSMANAGPGTNGSQFFITLGATPHLDGRHTVFGEVTEGMEVITKIGGVQTDAQDRPISPVKIESVSVARG